MRPIEIGLVLPMADSFIDDSTARWVEIRDLALRAEEQIAPVLELLDAD